VSSVMAYLQMLSVAEAAAMAGGGHRPRLIFRTTTRASDAENEGVQVGARRKEQG
jgi:hypothetical protein